MGFFDKLNVKDLDSEIINTEHKIKQSKFKINVLKSSKIDKTRNFDIYEI